MTKVDAAKRIYACFCKSDRRVDLRAVDPDSRMTWRPDAHLACLGEKDAQVFYGIRILREDHHSHRVTLCEAVYRQEHQVRSGPGSRGCLGFSQG